MAGIPKKKQPDSKPLLTYDLTKAIAELGQRISNLKEFDVKTLIGRLDANAKALEDKVNDTLSDIFGYDSEEYRNYAILSLDTLPIEVGGQKQSLPVLQKAYQNGINVCVTRLNSLKETLQQNRPDTKEDNRPSKQPISQ